jgi:hypothetical protein
LCEEGGKKGIGGWERGTWEVGRAIGGEEGGKKGIGGWEREVGRAIGGEEGGEKGIGGRMVGRGE